MNTAKASNDLANKARFHYPTFTREDEGTVRRKRDLDLTRAGLFLLIVGQPLFALASLYRLSFIDLAIVNLAMVLPSLLGGLLLALGRCLFGLRHARYAVWGLALTIIGCLVLAAHYSAPADVLLARSHTSIPPRNPLETA